MYRNLVDLPLPERFTDLLARLDQKRPPGS
jgi:hypothetical protein